MVGSVSDPVITSLITTVNDSAYWAGTDLELDGNAERQLPAAVSLVSSANAQLKEDEASDRLHLSDSSHCDRGFKFAGLTKPPSLLPHAQ